MSENDTSCKNSMHGARDRHDLFDLRAERDSPCDKVIHFPPFRCAYLVGGDGFTRHMITQYYSE